MDSVNEEKDKGSEKVDSEATSDELLSDVEEEEAEVDSGSSSPDPGPSPDGAFDEKDDVSRAGPM
ncbi:MAG TPA: hypothetical protein VJU86_21160 [Pyrinomonadaceae bacterium]|nr:hypothetical protein [Pyrinomonadaceae bacterium]